MHRTLYYPDKDPEERQEYTVDWAPMLEGDTVNLSAWTAVGAPIGPQTKTDTTTTAILEPGPMADQVILTNTITTNGGRTYIQQLQIGLAEPLSLDFVKDRLAVTSNHRDAEIAQLLSAARWHVEDYTGLILTRRQVVETLDSFDPILTTRAWPFVSLDSIGYLDANEQPAQVLAPRVRSAQRPVRIFPPVGVSWPLTAWPGEVTITMTAGYDHTLPLGHPEGIPPPLVTAMLLLIGHWLENRETVLVGTIATDLPHGWMALARPYRQLF